MPRRRREGLQRHLSFLLEQIEVLLLSIAFPVQELNFHFFYQDDGKTVAHFDEVSRLSAHALAD